jgi:hypothetical protein
MLVMLHISIPLPKNQDTYIDHQPPSPPTTRISYPIRAMLFLGPSVAPHNAAQSNPSNCY